VARQKLVKSPALAIATLSVCFILDGANPLHAQMPYQPGAAQPGAAPPGGMTQPSGIPQPGAAYSYQPGAAYQPGIGGPYRPGGGTTPPGTVYQPGTGTPLISPGGTVQPGAASPTGTR